MKKINVVFPLVVFSITNFLAHAQESIDTLVLPRAKEGSTYLSEVLYNENLGIGVFEVKYLRGRIKFSQLILLSSSEPKIRCVLEVKKHVYLDGSKFLGDSILLLDKGLFFNRTYVYDLKVGSRLTGEQASHFLKQSDDLSEEQGANGNNEMEKAGDTYVSNEDLYCTKHVVYFGGKGFFYQEEAHSMVVRKF